MNVINIKIYTTNIRIILFKIYQQRQMQKPCIPKCRLGIAKMFKGSYDKISTIG